jgi:type IV fimbrial biogenesis protein FimT
MSKKYKGFTTIEVLIVIGILVILASIGFPYFRKLYRVYKFNQYAFELENLVKWAKIAAMEKSHNISICLDETNKEIKIYDEGTSRSPNCYGNLLKVMKIKDSWITPNISVDLGKSGLMFDPRGLAIYEGEVCITDGERYFKAVLEANRGGIGIEGGSGGC